MRTGGGGYVSRKIPVSVREETNIGLYIFNNNNNISRLPARAYLYFNDRGNEQKLSS